MAQYINKVALVAEIEKRKQKNHKKCTPEGRGAYYEDGFILDIINSLEVKEVGLEEEKDSYVKIHKDIFTSVCQAILDGDDD